MIEARNFLLNIRATNKLPKEKQEMAADLTIEEVKAIIEEAKANPPKRVPRKKKTS